jgi:quercetin dioxygenase-like cupin family protein
MKPHPRFALAAACVAVLGVTASLAQAPGIKRTLLQRTDVGNNMEMILGLAEIAPGGSTGRHTHFGVESGYMIEGTASMEVEGETPRLIKAGESYTIPAGKVHDAKAVGDGPAKVLATYVVEKGKPLATPSK